MAALEWRTSKIVGTYSLVLGLGYLAVGLLEIIGGHGWVPGDLFGGLAVLVIGATYLSGVRELLAGKYEGVSFMVGGLLLSAAFGGLYLLLVVAQWLDYLIGEAEEFSASLRPEVFFLLVAIPLAYETRRLTRALPW